MSCETCEHYRYRCGMDKELQRQIGINWGVTTPTCFCLLAKVAWPRMSAEVRKPRGISCEYKPHEFTCEDCNQKISGKNKIWMVLTRESCICKKCGAKK